MTRIRTRIDRVGSLLNLCPFIYIWGLIASRNVRCCPGWNHETAGGDGGLKMVGSTLLPKDVVMRLLRGYDFLTYNEQKGGGLDLLGKIGIKRLMFLSA